MPAFQNYLIFIDEGCCVRICISTTPCKWSIWIIPSEYSGQTIRRNVHGRNSPECSVKQYSVTWARWNSTLSYWKPVIVGVQWFHERVKIVIENHNVTLPISDKICQSKRPKPSFINTDHIVMEPPDCTLFCWQFGSLASCNLHHIRTHQSEITGTVTHRTTLNYICPPRT